MESVRVQALLFVCRGLYHGLGRVESISTEGRKGLDAIGQEVVDFGSQLPGAVVYDAVGHDIFPLGREYAIISAV